METKAYNCSKKARLTACKIASLYLERFPRVLSYEVQMGDDEMIDLVPFCISLSEEKVDLIRKCYKIANDEGVSFSEILKTEFPELEKEILSHDKSARFVDSVDIDNPHAFTEFSFYQINEKGEIGNQGIKSIVLTDDLFKDLLVELLIHKNKYTTNMMAYKNPEQAKEVLYKLDNAVYSWTDTNTSPTAYDFYELKQICESILSPFKDILHLFDGEDKELRRFVHSHQVAPEEIQGDLLNLVNIQTVCK